MDESKLQETAGQLVIAGFEGKHITSEAKALIHTYRVGGIILFSRNIGKPEEVLKLTTDLQREAKEANYDYPLLICADQENGIVRRLGDGTTIFPGAMAQGATDEPRHAYDIGFATGKELLALGINWNLAPSIDVNNNPDNPVIGVRSFGESPEKVAEFGRASMKGMQDAGVITTIKHFPGHGDTDTDSHLNIPVIKHDMKRLEEIELKPFKACFDQGADTVLTAHVHFPAIESEDGLPATLSKSVLTGLLREKLHFNGVVTTDCMEMEAISKTIGTEKGAVVTIKAGSDFAMISHTFSRQKGAIKEIMHAITTGDITEETIQKASERIERLKEKYLSWSDVNFENNKIPEFVGGSAHQALASGVYRNSTTIVKNDQLLPLSTDEKVLVICSESDVKVWAEDKEGEASNLGEAIRKYDSAADVTQVHDHASMNEVDALFRQAKQYDVVILSILEMSPENSQNLLVNKLLEHGMPVVVVATRNPYALQYFPEVSAYINTYEPNVPALEIAAGAIFGKEKVNGKLPITVPNAVL